MALYSYQYQEPHLTLTNNSKRIYFFFGLTVGLFLFVVLLPLSLLIPYNQEIFVSPISANTEVNPEKELSSTSIEKEWESDTTQISFLINDSNGDQNMKNVATDSSALSDVSEQTQEGISKQSPPVISPSKNSYSIVVYGDSMVDTMGERLEYLEHALKRKYPVVNFTLYNFGKGAENVEMGLNRFGSEFHYQDRNYPSLPQIKPDIIIIGSFAYNPFTPHDRDRHWLGLTKMVEQSKSLTSNVYLLAEIAPIRKDFGKGPNGVNWEEQTNYEHSGRIIEQLENSIGLAKNLNVGLIDAFHPSLANSTEGKREYVNPGDGIHPNIAGHEFMAEKISTTIELR